MVLFPNERQAALERFAPRGADDVPDDQDIKAVYLRVEALTFFFDFKK